MRSGTGRRRLLHLVTAMVATAVVTLGWAPQADAEWITGGGVGGPLGIFTELQLTGTGPGAAVAAYDGPSDLDPLDGYPTSLPSGSTAHAVDFAGLIEATDAGTGNIALTYCIDLFTDTEVGVNYELAEWSEANVPNMGYVGYILHNYFPMTAAPAGADSFKAAAVQLAIWFFTDRIVLDTTSAYYDTVAAIAADALANGPSPEPDQPFLTVTPEEARAPLTGDIIGPFTVDGDGPGALTSIDVEVFDSPDGGTPLPDGTSIAPGTRLWVRAVSSTTPQGFYLDRTTTVQESTVYVYDGTNPGRDTAQKIVLAQENELTVRAGVAITPYAAGHLEITKSIVGDGAGFQGDVVIDVSCTLDGTTTEYSVTIEAGSTGDQTREIRNIDAGSECAISESADGTNDFVTVESVTIDPDMVTIAENATVTSTVTDVYERGVGALAVTKTIDGNAAGRQGAITIRVDCADPTGDVRRELTIPAGASAGTHALPVIDGLPAGAKCTVTEPTDGALPRVVTASVSIAPETVTIRRDATATVAIADTYRHALAPTGNDAGRLAVAGTAMVVTGLGLAGTARMLRRGA